MPGTRAFGRFLSPALVVVGRLDGAVLPEGVRVERRATFADLPVAAATVVADLRDVRLDDVLAWRRERAGDIPLVLASAYPVDEEVLDEAQVSDVLRVDRESERSIARRLALAVELGSARLALAFADQVLDESVNGLAIADASQPHAPLVEVSSVFERLTLYSRDELLGRNCRLLQRRDRDQPGIDQLRQAARTQSRTTAIVRNYKKDGAAFWNEVTIFPILVNGEKTQFMAGVQHDVTRVIEAQAEIDTLYRMLLAQRTFDNAILDGVEVGIITTNRSGGITFANRYGRELLQLGTDVSGEDVKAVLGLAEPPAELLGPDARRTLSYPLVTTQGAELDLELAVSRADGVEDERVGFFFIFRDARLDKQREEERRRFERLAAMGTMVAGFAHEVRNPVAALRSIAEELGEELAARGNALPHTSRMLRILERIERLVRTSLQFGRPAAPRRSAHRPWVVCSAALSAIAPRTRLAGQELRVDMDPELPDVFVDDGQLVQALVILLDNAIDAAGSARGVLLRVTEGRPPEGERGRRTEPPPGSRPPSPSRSWLRFEVIDDGPGIAAADVSRIFDPFFTTKPTGTGLGLSIAQQIVNENGGRLEVTTLPESPTTFAITLPAAPADVTSRP